MDLSKNYVSFDVFDTLLTRLTIVPKDVFYFCGIIAKDKGIIKCDAQTYSKLRIEAEQLSRTEKNDGQVTYHQIFEQLRHFMSLSDDELDLLVKIEFEFELSILRPIPGALELVNSHRKKGDTILFVSDMYWTSKEIKAFLASNGFYIEGDQVWVSSDEGATKESGRLFEKLIQSNSIQDRKKIKHYGNDIHVDIGGANKVGINSEYLDKGNPNHYELLYSKNVGYSNGLSSIFGGVSRMLRLQKLDNERLSLLKEITADVIAPSMTLFTLWVLEDAKKRQLKQLNFISRDGYVPYIIAKILAPKLGYDIELKYLYGSRQAWHIAGVQEFSDFFFEWLFDDINYSNISNVLGKLDITWDEFSKIYSNSAYSENDSMMAEGCCDFIRNAILNSKELQALILSKSESKKHLVLQYLKQENFNFKDKIGMVEMGWSGRARNSFIHLIEQKQTHKIQWYYMGIAKGMKLFDLGSVSTYLYGPNFRAELIQYLPLIIESFCLAPHGSVVGFEIQDEVVQAKFMNKLEDQLQSFGRSDYFKFIEAYCHLLPIDLIKETGVVSTNKMVFDVLKQFCENPSKNEAMLWGKMPFIHNQGSNHISTLAYKPKTSLANLRSALLYGDFKRSITGSDWGVWGAGSWHFRKSNLIGLRIFSFIGHLRVNYKSEIKRCFGLTKSYIKELFKMA